MREPLLYQELRQEHRTYPDHRAPATSCTACPCGPRAHLPWYWRPLVHPVAGGSPTSLFWLLTARLAFDRDPHGAGGSLDDLHCLSDVIGVQVGQLQLGDAAQLVPADRPHPRLVRIGGPLGGAGRLLEEDRGRRGLQDELEGPILVDRHLYGDDRAGLGSGSLVVAADELHDVDAVGAEGGTDRRGGRGLAGRDLELDHGPDLLLPA